VVTDILQIVETYDPDEAQMQLVMRGEGFFTRCAVDSFDVFLLTVLVFLL